MNLSITAKNIEVTDALRGYVEKKMSRLEKITDINEIWVTLSVEKYRQIVDVKLNADGEIIKAKETSKDMYTSVDLVYEVLERQLRRLKERYEDRRKITASKTEITTEPRIIMENFTLRPMSVEEAVTYLEAAKEQFMVFENVENGKVSILFCKTDGNYGLIETR
ncbi:MAG: ribosome-associated translation inhibitor RaiA [Deltaproteobacteria bacterium]|nr:ribosome-associated translation inhibitor RaiA [Deltaproteobacteria bacterium]